MKFNDVNGKKFGLDDSDFKKGITTIEQKLNLLCPNYTFMDQLMKMTTLLVLLLRRRMMVMMMMMMNNDDEYI